MIAKEDEFSKEGKIYKKIFEDQKDTKEEEKNTIKIAGRNIEVYNQTILNKLQKFDQIEIIVLDSYLDKALYIIKQWEALGIVPAPGFLTKGKTIRFEKKEEDIWSREGKKYRKPVNRITLTKHPDIFRFTKK
ncbi:unnamed protein product [marine sediment metagenome]|uniref:Uncharacterized protein n=1 Tax=marine sediment metagenome TaxID=412755 RepID=X1DGF5_9ZZZZ